jgi:hypothetical protein
MESGLDHCARWAVNTREYWLPRQPRALCHQAIVCVWEGVLYLAQVWRLFIPHGLACYQQENILSLLLSYTLHPTWPLPMQLAYGTHVLETDKARPPTYIHTYIHSLRIRLDETAKWCCAWCMEWFKGRLLTKHSSVVCVTKWVCEWRREREGGVEISH